MYNRILVFVLLTVSVTIISVIVAGTSLTEEKERIGEVMAETEETNNSSGWTTYTNKTYGFKFEYPAKWYSGRAMRKTRGGNEALQICLNPRGTAGDCYGIITVHSNVDLETHYDEMKNLFLEYEVKESTTLVGGVPARLFTVSGYEKGREGFTRGLVFEHAGFVYTILVGEGRAPDHIIESFYLLKD